MHGYCLHFTTSLKPSLGPTQPSNWCSIYGWVHQFNPILSYSIVSFFILHQANTNPNQTLVQKPGTYHCKIIYPQTPYPLLNVFTIHYCTRLPLSYIINLFIQLWTSWVIPCGEGWHVLQVQVFSMMHSQDPVLWESVFMVFVGNSMLVMDLHTDAVFWRGVWRIQRVSMWVALFFLSFSLLFVHSWSTILFIGSRSCALHRYIALYCRFPMRF